MYIVSVPVQVVIIQNNTAYNSFHCSDFLNNRLSTIWF